MNWISLGAANFRATAEVRIDFSTLLNTTGYWGISQDAWNSNGVYGGNAISITTPQKDAIHDDLFTFAKINHVKTLTNLPAVEPTNDNADPLVADPAGFDWAGLQTPDDFSDLMAGAESRVGTSLIHNDSPVDLPNWMEHVTAWTGLNAGDVCNATAHGFTNGQRVVLSGKSGGASLSTAAAGYYIINATANTFQLSTTSGGSAADFGSDVTACNASLIFATSTDLDPQEYAELVLQVMQRWQDNGHPLTHFTIVNEPDYTRLPATGAWMRDAIKALGPRMLTAGLGYIKLVIPEGLNPTGALDRAETIMADPDAAKFVGAISTHLYGNPPSLSVNYASLEALSALAKQYGLPLWMGEFWWPTTDTLGWAKIMDRLLGDYDAEAVYYLWGFYGDQDDAQLLAIDYTAPTTYVGFSRRKAFYEMCQWTRFVQPGARRMNVASEIRRGSGGVQITAFKNPDETFAIVAVNPDATNTVDIRFGLYGNNTATLKLTRTSATENLATLPPANIGAGTDGRFSVTLAAKSVTTFTA